MLVMTSFVFQVLYFLLLKTITTASCFSVCVNPTLCGKDEMRKDEKKKNSVMGRFRERTKNMFFTKNMETWKRTWKASVCVFGGISCVWCY